MGHVVVDAFVRVTSSCAVIAATSSIAGAFIYVGNSALWNTELRSSVTRRGTSSCSRTPANTSSDTFVEATHRWIEELVIGEGLCPWAHRARGNTRILVVQALAVELEANVDLVLQEADALLQAAAGGSTGAARPGAESLRLQMTLHTTLLVFASKDFDGQAGLPAFCRLWQAVEAGLKASAGEGESGIELLAFHPRREDRGPGCRASPVDAGHFAVRAPFPTLQLLPAMDLQAARAAWAERHGGPGALSLLLANKQRLRALNSGVLASRLAQFRSAADVARASDHSGCVLPVKRQAEV